MKNLFFLIISVFFLSINAWAQQLDSVFWESNYQGNWFPFRLEQLHYDNNSKLISKTTLKWDNVLDPPINLYKDDYTNNMIGQKTENLSYIWDANTSLWDISVKNMYAYSSTGKLVEYIRSAWQGTNIWKNDIKNSYLFDANDYLVQDYTFQWKSINYVWQWDSVYRTDFVNNASGDAEVIRHYFHHPTYWELVTIDSVSYMSGKKHSFRRFVNPGTWVKETEIIYTYDANGFLVSEEKEFWQVGAYQTSIKNKINYLRSNMGLNLQETHQRFDTTLSSWVDASRITYYYASVTSIAEQQNINDVKIFPNPVHNELTIQANNEIHAVKIMDCQARQLMSKYFNSKTIQIDISDFAPGVYFIYLQHAKQSRVIKFVKD